MRAGPSIPLISALIAAINPESKQWLVEVLDQ